MLYSSYTLRDRSRQDGWKSDALLDNMSIIVSEETSSLFNGMNYAIYIYFGAYVIP